MEVMLSWVKPRLPPVPSWSPRYTPDEIAEHKAIFRLFDTDHSGFIEASEFQARMEKYHFRQESIDNLFSKCDLSGDGRLSEAEFLGMLHGHMAPGSPSRRR